MPCISSRSTRSSFGRNAGSDRTIPYGRYGRPLMDAVPGAELVVLPGVGHVPMVDNPALVAWTILQHTRYQVAS